MPSPRALLILLGSCWLPAYGADAGYAAKAVDLLERPGSRAKVVTTLAKKQPVEIIGRDGSWAKTKSGNATGWVRLADLRLKITTSKPTALPPSGSSRKDTGIRGFSEEELLVGAPNQVEGERLKQLGVTTRDAAGFARAANLRPRQQDYIEMREYMPEGGFPQGFFDE
ncbi:MAG TPA: SH3 domain-containing protein [Burkholderiales bacterium]|nr:SH3 domain-containing protein [Burkholderiales bacterium]